MNRVTGVTLADGLIVETVYYPYDTLCISSQAGCRIGCPFCASGRKGLVRSLTYEELVKQAETADSARITISGIGEPLDNFVNVKRFIESSERPVSVTTTGGSELLKELLMMLSNGVMISVHSGREETHKKLVPKSRTLDEIFADIDEVWGRMSVRARKRVGFNYLLTEGINDGQEELDAYVSRVAKYPQAVTHLLVMNPVDRSPYKSPSKEKFDGIYDYLRSKGLSVRRSNQWRKEELGGCGTLWLRSQKEKC